MARGGGVVAGRAPSQAAYYVALAGVALLLLMLCCYFLYFCITKIRGQRPTRPTLRSVSAVGREAPPRFAEPSGPAPPAFVAPATSDALGAHGYTRRHQQRDGRAARPH